MSSYAAPADVWISATWQDHKNRNPPSSEPGTDYATAYWTPVLCADSGTVVDRKDSTSGGTGRYVTIRLNDGRTVRYLHLAEVWVGVGQHVDRGQWLAASGASGHGSEWGYGAHVHVTLWPGAIWASPTIDFERYVGEPEPEEPEMTPEQWAYLQAMNAKLDDINVGVDKIIPDTDYIPGMNGKLDGIQSGVETLLVAPSASALTGPGYLIGAFLGLIGLVEVLRFIVDVVT
jgi:murein DD-endopeptidase MepM/ murein hydrolase activator NlpD